MNPSFVTIVIPFEPHAIERVHRAIESLSNAQAGNAPRPDIKQKIDSLALVHYMSLLAVDVECPATASEPIDAKDTEREAKAHLLIEATVDAPIDDALTALADTLFGEIESVLVAAGIDHAGQTLAELFRRHHHPINPGWGFGRAVGQIHVGAPGMTVRRILREHALAERLGRRVLEYVETDRLGGSPCSESWRRLSPAQRLDRLRSDFWSLPDMKWAFVDEPAPCMPADPSNPWDSSYTAGNRQARKALFTAAVTFLWPLWLVLAVIWAAVAWHAWGVSSDFFDWAGRALLAGLALLGVQLALLFAAAFKLRRQEKLDPSDETVPPDAQVRALLEKENFLPQNHMATVSRLKPGVLRSLTLRLAFVVVGTGRFVGAPGFLGVNGVIHVARWMRLPGTNQLVFWSNYDGTWVSYVADFIADAPSGVTAIWSNCRGFPAAYLLFGRGARQRDRLVNWARRQQLPTRFWYCAYPDISAARIRINAAIRQGLACARSDADARDWLALFGSQVRPPRELELPEVPTLVFGGLTSRRSAASLLVRLRSSSGDKSRVASDREAARTWLSDVEPLATFGPAPVGKPAVAVALASSGLRKLGLPQEAIATFPTAYQQGMAAPWRARALGDTYKNAPDRWDWGGCGEDGATHADVIVLVYASTQTELRATLDPIVDKARRCGHEIVGETAIPLHLKEWQRPDAPAGSPSPATGRFVEPFGFVDGISQPVIRGAPRNGASALSSDLVEPGEIVLGYPDNVGEIAPAPGLAARHDPQHLLADKGCDTTRRRPEFSRYEPLAGERDLGINGTFLVVRQLEQHDARFADWCKRSFEQVKNHPALELAMSAQAGNAVASASPSAGSSRGGAELVSSLVVGRWPDGSSRVRNPVAPASGAPTSARPDNAFMLGAEDPRGFACPFGAHVRRANPRDTRQHDTPQESKTELESVNRHRILRIGRRYGEHGPDPSAKSGLMFMCLNANIERQFEFVQKSWLLNRSLHGLENETDPLIGQLAPDGAPRTFTVPTPNGPISLKIDVDFVRVAGGGYFFMPGRATLRYLASNRSPAGAAAAQEAAASPKLACPISH